KVKLRRNFLVLEKHLLRSHLTNALPSLITKSKSVRRSALFKGEPYTWAKFVVNKAISLRERLTIGMRAGGRTVSRARLTATPGLLWFPSTKLASALRYGGTPALPAEDTHLRSGWRREMRPERSSTWPK